MRPFIWMTLVLFTLSGCGAADSREKAPSAPPVLPLISTRDQPVVYELADPDCQSRMELVNLPLTLTETWVTTTSGDNVIRQRVTLPRTQTKASLQNEAVAKTTYGENYERVCDFRKPKQARCVNNLGREIPFYRKGLNGPLPLKICKDQHQYPLDSYETVSLTAAYQLGRTRQFYLKAAPESPPPLRVVLSMFPTFAEIYDYFPQLNKSPGRLVTYMTHNLAYFPESEEIVIFPETVNATSKHKLWESPFVLSHEYGHHIDHIRHKNSYSQAGLLWSATRHSFIDLVAQGSLDPGVEKATFQALQGDKPLSMTPKALLTTAMGEAFADLIAFYTEGESSASILTFDEIGTDRDILSPRFANGLEKILSRRHTNTFFNQFEAKTPEGRLNMMTGVHTIGAILAYGVHELFSSLTASTVDDEARTLAKYRLLLDLMDDFTGGLGQLDYQSSSSEVLGIFAKAIQKTLDQALPTLKAAIIHQNPEDGPGLWKKTKAQICDQLGSSFPDLAEDGFKVEDPC